MPSSGHDFVMQPHEDPLLAVGFLEIEPRGQFEARQAIEIDVAGECRHSRIVLGSLMNVVDDSGAPGRDGSADKRLLEQLVSLPPRPRAFAEPSIPSRPSCVAVVTVASGEPGRAVLQAQRGVALASFPPGRPRPTEGAGAVSGVRLSAASAPLATTVESPPVGESLQVVPGAPVASRCRHRHALAIEPVVLPADSRPSLFRHGEARTRAVRLVGRGTPLVATDQNHCGKVLGGGRTARRRSPRDGRAARRDGRAASFRVRHVGVRVARTLDEVLRLRLVPPWGWGVSAARRWRAAPTRVGAL